MPPAGPMHCRADARESGTVFEIESAIAAGKANQKPAVYVLRKTEEVKFGAKTVEEEKQQYDSLMAWWNRTFVDQEGYYRHGYQLYELLEEFEPASRRYFELALKTGTYYGLFAEVSGEVAGGGGVVIADWPGSPLNFEPRRAWILNIYVEPQHRRTGLARTITRALVEWCKEKGFQSVALHASDYGRGLYEKLGFRGTNEMRLLL